MVLSQAELDRLFPPPLAPHCEGCHPYGEKAAETFVEDPETGARMACDAGGPHTHRLCRQHVDIGKTAPGEGRQAAPGDRPEGASPPPPRERGLHWAPSAPQSPAPRTLHVGLCETHHDRAKSGTLQVMVQYPVKSENCTACQLEVVVALKNEIAVLVYQRNVAQDEASTSQKELKQAQVWVSTIREQRDAARAETRSFQKELAEVRGAYLAAERACLSLRELVAERDERLKRLRKRKRKAKVKKKQGARR